MLEKFVKYTNAVYKPTNKKKTLDKVDSPHQNTYQMLVQPTEDAG